ncbi:MAG TPA: hypothetical protein PKE00_05770 [Planctomycetota bacterium]|nr:hypothetical protein [Planctomycetota bacterium]
MHKKSPEYVTKHRRAVLCCITMGSVVAACSRASEARETWVAHCEQECKTLHTGYQSLLSKVNEAARSTGPAEEKARMLAARVKARVEQVDDVARMISKRSAQHEIRSQLAILKARLAELEAEALR